MRVYAVYLFVFLFSVYAYRHWYRSLCALILMTAVIQHPDMPFNIMGIQGLNPWNILCLNVVMGWVINRRREGLVWDMPKSLSVLLAMYLLIVMVGFFRMIVDPAYLEGMTTAQLTSEMLVNTVKWAVPGLLLFHGCRSRRRLLGGLICALGVYFLLAVQVARWIPMSVALEAGTLTARSRKIILNEVGFHAVNMSMMLAGASWAILSTLPSLGRWKWRLPVLGAALLVVYAQALTAGRMGYVTWIIVGILMCSLRWRRYLLLIPAVIVALCVVLPGPAERMLDGFSRQDVSGETYMDQYQITSGRSLIWPHVGDRIAEAPIFGYGRLGMRRVGLTQRLADDYGERFGHPHNAYLQWLLDNGIVGFVPLILFYALVVRRSIQLFLARGSPLLSAVGGVTLALVFALLVASMGSQTFYPREGAVAMWAAIGLMLRASCIRRVGKTLRADPGSNQVAVTGRGISEGTRLAKYEPGRWDRSVGRPAS
jgi:O-antigen ligase